MSDWSEIAAVLRDSGVDELDGAALEVAEGIYSGWVLDAAPERGRWAVIAATLKAAVDGERVHVVIPDSDAFDGGAGTLRRAADALGVSIGQVTALQTGEERRAEYRSQVTICPLAQLVEDRADDLGRWPTRSTPTHRQFDRLYGTRSASLNRLVPAAARAIVYAAERVLIDQIAMRATITAVAGTAPRGAVHALNVMRSYPRVGGVGTVEPGIARDVHALYGARVRAGRRAPSPGKLVRDRSALAGEVLRLTAEARTDGRAVHVLIGDAALAASLGDQARALNLHRSWQSIEASLARNPAPALVIATALDPTPGSVRRFAASFDPGGRHRLIAIYSLDEPLLQRALAAPVRAIAKRSWHRWTAPALLRLVHGVANREERRQRRAFVAHTTAAPRRFAFADPWERGFG